MEITISIWLIPIALTACIVAVGCYWVKTNSSDGGMFPDVFTPALGFFVTVVTSLALWFVWLAAMYVFK